MEKTQNSYLNSEREEASQRTLNTQLQELLYNDSNQDSMVLEKE
jgi:hypothetical protein